MQEIFEIHLIMTIQVNLVMKFLVKYTEGNENSPELSFFLVELLSLTYHRSNFLAATLDFTY